MKNFFRVTFLKIAPLGDASLPPDGEGMRVQPVAVDGRSTYSDISHYLEGELLDAELPEGISGNMIRQAVRRCMLTFKRPMTDLVDARLEIGTNNVGIRRGSYMHFKVEWST